MVEKLFFNCIFLWPCISANRHISLTVVGRDFYSWSFNQRGNIPSTVLCVLVCLVHVCWYHSALTMVSLSASRHDFISLSCSGDKHVKPLMLDYTSERFTRWLIHKVHVTACMVYLLLDTFLPPAVINCPVWLLNVSHRAQVQQDLCRECS